MGGGSDGGTVFAFERVGIDAPTGGRPLLDDVTLEVPGRGITVLAGPSGSGKSTLLRLCNRLEVPSRGVVRYRGDDVASLDPRRLRREVGMVFQRPTLFDGTVLANLRVADSALTSETGAELLRRVGLDPGLLDRDGRQLSGGEQQRACLARTLATRPRVLLMDEPTSALDPDSTHTLEHLARTLAERGTPIVWVSHDRGQQRRLADWLVLLEAGRVVLSEAADAAGHEHHEEGPFG